MQTKVVCNCNSNIIFGFSSEKDDDAIIIYAVHHKYKNNRMAVFHNLF